MTTDGTTILDFLSPDLGAPDLAPAETAWRSPLDRALAEAPLGIEDVSRTGKLEVRGDLDALDVAGAELVRITATRGLVLCDFEGAAELRLRLGASALVFDVSAAYAGLRVRREALLRRLTDLDPATLPAVGQIHGVRTLFLRDEGETFRLFFPQEYGHSVAEIVIDAARGLTR